MKATYAALHYGAGAYPVHEANLPEVAIEPVIEAVRQHMGKLAGGFNLEAPDYVSLEIIGNGYVVRLIADAAELAEAVAL